MTHSPGKNLLESWRHADRQARELEQALFAEAMHSLNGEGPAPSQAQWDHARQVREHAKALFQLAMQEVSRGRSEFTPPPRGNGTGGPQRA